MPQRILFKVAFLTFICVRGGAGPTRLHSDGESQRRAGLRSAGRGDLAVLRTATEVTELSKRSFPVVALEQNP